MNEELWPQEIWLCSSDACGLRFPARQGEARATACPLCESITSKVLTFERPPASQEPARPGVDPGGNRSLLVVLDNIRSANNVGSMIRTADAVGASVALCGITATPDNPKVAKTSLGAHDHVEWTYDFNAVALIQQLKSDGATIWALELTDSSVPLQSLDIPAGDLVLVVGNEVSGVDPGILELADAQVHLPMIGTKTSLNVAVAMGAAAYLLRV